MNPESRALPLVVNGLGLEMVILLIGLRLRSLSRPRVYWRLPPILLARFCGRFRRRQQSCPSFNTLPASVQVLPASVCLLPLVGNPTLPPAFVNVGSGYPVIRMAVPLPVPRRPYKTVARRDQFDPWHRGRHIRSIRASYCGCCNCAACETQRDETRCAMRLHMHRSS